MHDFRKTDNGCTLRIGLHSQEVCVFHLSVCLWLLQVSGKLHSSSMARPDAVWYALVTDVNQSCLYRISWILGSARFRGGLLTSDTLRFLMTPIPSEVSAASAFACKAMSQVALYIFSAVVCNHSKSRIAWSARQ